MPKSSDANPPIRKQRQHHVWQQGAVHSRVTRGDPYWREQWRGGRKVDNGLHINRVIVAVNAFRHWDAAIFLLRCCVERLPSSAACLEESSLWAIGVDRALDERAYLSPPFLH
jgi:hypothetical protein